MSFKVSEKYILNIKEYMINFLGVSYTGCNKLTHKEMNIFLCEKKHCVPDRVSFSKIKKEDILKGKCLLVKDELNQIIPYSNPMSLEKLMSEILLYQKVKEKDSGRKEIVNKVMQKKLIK